MEQNTNPLRPRIPQLPHALPDVVLSGLRYGNADHSLRLDPVLQDLTIDTPIATLAAKLEAARKAFLATAVPPVGQKLPDRTLIVSEEVGHFFNREVGGVNSNRHDDQIPQRFPWVLGGDHRRGSFDSRNSQNAG